MESHQINPHLHMNARTTEFILRNEKSQIPMYYCICKMYEMCQMNK